MGAQVQLNVGSSSICAIICETCILQLVTIPDNRIVVIQPPTSLPKHVQKLSLSKKSSFEQLLYLDRFLEIRKRYALE